MRIDVVSIFPGYLDALDLSLVGKARRDGVLDLRMHDLRSWTADRHRTVDDTPFGGGAGMVMRPDVWGAALDDLLAESETGPEILVPSPAGEPFTQALAQELATREHLVIACGRYEGIDSRVAEHYRQAGRTVREVSLGDYVLNGGEAAALVMIEAVARLLPGVVGNPESLVEESHGSAGLLEYPVYTKPARWREHAVPEVLLSGDHGRIRRWRRDRALARTADLRPDMLRTLDTAELDAADRAQLARHGWATRAGTLERVRYRDATAADAPALAELAARTFPLACAPQLPAADVDAFVAEHLSAGRMAAHVADDGRLLVVAERVDAPALLGYGLVVLPTGAEQDPDDPDVAAAVRPRPVAELSKCYVEEEYQGSGLAVALTERVLADAAAVQVDGTGLAGIWLGTNRDNRRARAFYRKLGFAVTGRRRFRVGERWEQDVVMVRDLTLAPDREVSPR